MAIFIMTGIIIAVGLIVFALHYSRNSSNNRSFPANKKDVSSSTISHSSTSNDSESQADAICADGYSSCDGGSGGD